ncbi:MAG TPA: hypothetical protein VIH27_01470 [Nitrososphaerales archaeon]
MDVIPIVRSLSEEVLSQKKFQEATHVAQKLLGNRSERSWAIAKVTDEFEFDQASPLLCLRNELKQLPVNTRICMRYLGDYINLITNDLTCELVGGKARRNSLVTNASILLKTDSSLKNLALKLQKYAGFIYTPGKRDFGLNLSGKHRFTPAEVILVSYVTAELAREIKSISKISRGTT